MNEFWTKVIYSLFAAMIVMFLCCAQPTFGAECSPSERKTYIAKSATKLFYKLAAQKSERFLWTDWECEQLQKQAILIATAAINKICKQVDL